jgi:hypothetical protein
MANTGASSAAAAYFVPDRSLTGRSQDLVNIRQAGRNTDETAPITSPHFANDRTRPEGNTARPQSP